MSIGLATAAGPDVRFGSMFRDGDRALYAAKERGRDRVVAAGDLASVAGGELPADAQYVAAVTS
jgi:hypothetical protein